MMIKIKCGKSEDTYLVRNAVLRPGLPIGSCHFAGDDDKETIHFIAEIDGVDAGIASVYIESSDKVTGAKQYRLRGMATLETYQGQGIGSRVLLFVIEQLTKKGVDVLWCNARTSALPFYQRLGFEVIGDEFEIESVGPHYVMAKYL